MKGRHPGELGQRPSGDARPGREIVVAAAEEPHQPGRQSPPTVDLLTATPPTTTTCEPTEHVAADRAPIAVYMKDQGTRARSVVGHVAPSAKASRSHTERGRAATRLVRMPGRGRDDRAVHSAAETVLGTRVWLLGVPAAAGALLAAGIVGFVIGSRDDSAR
jgi:hypothetical protein